MSNISEVVAQLGDEDPVKAYRARRSLTDEVDKLAWTDESGRRRLADGIASELATTVHGESEDAESNVGYGRYLRGLAAKNAGKSTTAAVRPKHSSAVRN